MLSRLSSMRTRSVRGQTPVVATRTHRGAGRGCPPGQRARRLANLLNLSTPLGLPWPASVAPDRGPARTGWCLAEGYRFRFPVAGAFTVGDVVITGATFEALSRWYRPARARGAAQPAVRGLPRVPYLPLYTVAMGWSVLRTGDRASATCSSGTPAWLPAGTSSAPSARSPPRSALPCVV